MAWVVVSCCAVAPAVAQPLDAGDRPWQRGVSAAQRQEAEREFRAGNALFERLDYAAAAERYRAALAAWAHPSIQFNLAVCLINLDRPVEAYDLVQAALRFGAEGLRGHYDEAKNYALLLAGRVSTLEVELPAGARVTLDGEPLSASEGLLARRRLPPGRHALVARKDGFEVWSKDLVLAPGEVTRERISLRAPQVRSVRRWSATMPWWVLGGAAVVGGAGAAALLVGNADQRAVSAAVAQRCPPPTGCPKGLPVDLQDAQDRVRLNQRFGVAAMAIGGAAVMTGVVLLVLNQPRQVLTTERLSLEVTARELAVGWTYAF